MVGTQVGGFHDSVVDGTTGIVVPAENPQALANALCCIIGDPVRAERMGEFGRRHVQERFDWDGVGDKLADLIVSI